MLTAILFINGCSPQPITTPSSKRAGSPSGSAAKPTAAQVIPITEQQANQFARQLEQTVASGDAEEASRHIAWDVIFAKATAVPADPEFDDSRESFEKGFLAAGNLMKEIVKSTQRGMTFKFLRTQTQAEQMTVLFRSKGPAGEGLNYIRLTLGRNPQGTIQANDLFFMLAGEEASEILRRSWLESVAADTKGASAKERASDRKAVSDQRKEIIKMGQQFRQGNIVQAIKLYRAFPREIREKKESMLMYLTALQHVSDQEVSDEELARAAADWLRLFGESASFDLLMLGNYTRRKKVNEALQCLERLYKAVGGDPALTVRKVILLTDAGRFKDAHTALDEVLRAAPDEPDSHIAVLTLSLAERKFEEAAKVLTVLLKQFGYQWPDIETNPMFAEFVKSPQYRKWKESQPPAKP